MKWWAWCKSDSKIYVDYHDSDRGIINNNDFYLFEILLLESFHCDLSWL